jgi:quinol monooxygenase YgiN
MVVVIVKASIQPGKQADLRRMANIMEELAAHEEGCEQFESFIDGDNFTGLGIC